MQKIKNWLYRFMYGRYGHDSLNITIIVVAMLVSIISSLFFKSSTISGVIFYALFLLSFFRMFSRNIAKRQAENRLFRNFTRPIRARFNLIKMRLKDKDRRYYLCPKCKSTVRVPKGRGKVEITCPKCHTEFTKRS